MTDRETPPKGDREASLSNQSTPGGSALRRDFLKSSAVAGALALGAGSFATGGASAGIPTPRLHRDGNLIKDPEGNTVTLRGVNIADPKRINVTSQARGMTATQVIDMLTDESDGWYNRVIRVPVQPVDIGEYEPGSGPPVPAFNESELETYLTDHLDEVVQHCADRGVYCIIDYHRHRDVQWAEGQDGPVNTELQDEVESLREEREDLKGKLARKQADFKNYKERQKRKQEQLKERATEDLVERLVDVRDNLKRALDQDVDDDESIRGGVEMTLKEFDRVLADENVEEISPEAGEDVDPQRHEVMVRVDSDQPEGTVAEVFNPGYEMADRVIQAAQVTVSTGAEHSPDDGAEHSPDDGAEHSPDDGEGATDAEPETDGGDEKPAGESDSGSENEDGGEAVALGGEVDDGSAASDEDVDEASDDDISAALDDE
jgi:molecular chaperone GrpE (heat shock protein)